MYTVPDEAIELPALEFDYMVARRIRTMHTVSEVTVALMDVREHQLRQTEADFTKEPGWLQRTLPEKETVHRYLMTGIIAIGMTSSVAGLSYGGGVVVGMTHVILFSLLFTLMFWWLWGDGRA